MAKIEIIGRQPDLPASPAVRCPHCKTERPPYGFILNGGDLGIVGQVQYFTIFCAAAVPGKGTQEKDAGGEICGCILGVHIIGYRPPQDAAQIAALQQALRGGPTQ
jgi:hypothetical protein